MTEKSSIIKFLRTSGIFFVGTVLSKAISFLMLPLYTRKIPTGDMGYYDVSLTYLTIITSMLFFDIWVAILRYMYDKEGKEDKASVIKSGSLIFFLSSITYILIGCILLLNGEIESIGWILLYGLVNNVSQIVSFCARGYGKNKEFAVSGVLNTIVTVLMNLLLILGMDMGYVSLYIASIIGFVVQILYLSLVIHFFDIIKDGRFEKKLMYSMFKYSLPLCLNSTAYWLLASLNRIILNGVWGDSANGIYAIGNKFSVVISLATTCFTYAWQDISFSKANEKGVGEFYSKACELYIVVLSICVCLVLPIIKCVFPWLVEGDYVEAEENIPLFLVVAVISAVSTFIGNVFYAVKETKVIFVSMVAAAALNILIGYPMIVHWGINGANLAVVLSFGLNIVIRNCVLKKKIGFKLGPQAFLYVLFVIVCSGIFLRVGMVGNICLFVFEVMLVLWVYRKSVKRVIKIVLSKR